MARDFVALSGDVSAIHNKMVNACIGAGLPWNEIFSSLKDGESPLRDAAIEAWNTSIFKRTTVLQMGEVIYEVVRPVIKMPFFWGERWVAANLLDVLPLSRIDKVPGLWRAIRDLHGSQTRFVGFQSYRSDKYSVATISFPEDPWDRPKDEGFGPHDIFVVRTQPEDLKLEMTDYTKENFVVFRGKEQLVGLRSIQSELKRQGCKLAPDSELSSFSTLLLPHNNSVYVSGELMFAACSVYSPCWELERTIPKEEVVVLSKGAYVIGKLLQG